MKKACFTGAGVRSEIILPGRTGDLPGATTETTTAVYFPRIVVVKTLYCCTVRSKREQHHSNCVSTLFPELMVFSMRVLFPLFFPSTTQVEALYEYLYLHILGVLHRWSMHTVDTHPALAVRLCGFQRCAFELCAQFGDLPVSWITRFYQMPFGGSSQTHGDRRLVEGWLSFGHTATAEIDYICR